MIGIAAMSNPNNKTKFEKGQKKNASRQLSVMTSFLTMIDVIHLCVKTGSCCCLG
jgi:hypothetical protein